MMDAPAFHEFLEIVTGKLRSTISAETERYTDFSEVTAEDADGVVGSSIAFTWDNDGPAGESVCDNEEGFSRDSKKVGGDRLKGPIGTVIIQERFLLKTGL